MIKKILSISVLSAFLLCLLFLLFSVEKTALPSFEGVRGTYSKSDALLLDRKGEVIHERRVDFQGRRLDWTTIRDMSPLLLRVVVRSEDKRFYLHKGVDWYALSAASLKNLFTSRPRGASTITMQLVSILTPEMKTKGGRKTFLQKLKQMTAARKLERCWSKGRILEAYLNMISFRGELQGISSASRGLFGKEPGGLDERESLILASLIPSPNASIRTAAKRACSLGVALGARADSHEITALARRSLSRAYHLKPRIALAPHVASMLLSHQKKRMVSTLDGDLQRFATNALRHHLAGLRERHVFDGAVLVAENETGNVLAYVGNIGERASARHVDGIRAHRQAGSTLKPFLYGLAFEKRILTPASLLEDSPLDVSTTRGIYSPGNYDNLYRGFIPARKALASSLNIPAIRTLSLIGENVFVEQMKRLGITGLREGAHYGLSLALGTADICLWELVNAYRTLANKGVWGELTLVPEREREAHRRVFSKEIAFIISDIISDREARTATFGLETPLSTRFWSAVKTGTSMDMRDNWCIGYSASYTVGVWVGNFSGEPMWNVSGMTGAAPLWFEIMNYLHEGVGSRQPPLPKKVIEKEVRFHETGVKSKERFLKGTETDVIRGHSLKRFPKIIYPPHGAIIALDPDIPPDRQKILFESTPGNRELSWVLNGKICGSGDSLGWTPTRGAFELSLVGEKGHVKDRVSFKVR